MKKENDTPFDPMPEAPEQEPADTAAEEPSPEELLREARRDIRNGLLWCVGGIAFTLLSYRLAAAGGRYTIATGAIVWGLLQALRGGWRLMSLYRRARDRARMWQTAAGALFLVALTVLLATRAGSLLGDGEQLDLLDEKQEYARPEIGLHVTIPAGYTAWTEEYNPETDSTYAYSYMYVLDGEWEMNIQTLRDAISPDAERIGDMLEYCMNCDSSYYDGGIASPCAPYLSEGREMLRSEGRRKEYPDYRFTYHYIKHGRSLVTVSIIYPEAEAGKTSTQRRAENLLRGIRLEAPAAER